MHSLTSSSWARLGALLHPNCTHKAPLPLIHPCVMHALTCKLLQAFLSWSRPCMWAHGAHLQVFSNGIQDKLYFQLCGLRPGRNLCAAVCAHTLTVSDAAHIGKTSDSSLSIKADSTTTTLLLYSTLVILTVH